MREDLKSVDPAAQVLLKVAGQKKLETSFDRAERLKPCPIGHQGACCKMCHMGPCRLVGKEEEAEGVCGATLPVVAARNFARMGAAGTAAHSDHARDLANTLLAVAISERKRTEQQLVSLQKEMEELSFRDGLTGVANRRRFDAVVEIEWSNARRNRQPLSLLMIDIDYFKQYNDRYGHLEGDACLKQVARVLGSAATRARDLLARFGGEEFVLVLPETDQFAARKLAERCRELILAERIPHESSPIGPVLTISLGVGSTIPGPGDELRAFIDTVD